MTTLTLANIEAANLTGGAGNNLFTVTGWTGTGTITGGGGSDTITATKDVNFAIADASLATGDGMNLGLSGIGTATLTGGASANSFDVSGWTGAGTIDGAGGTDTVVASNNSDFTLTNTSLARTGTTTLTLANIEAATLTGGVGANTFTVSGRLDRDRHAQWRGRLGHHCRDERRELHPYRPFPRNERRNVYESRGN